MGSTLVAALLRGNSLAIANVGDSRIYLIRKNEIQASAADFSIDHIWADRSSRLERRLLIEKMWKAPQHRFCEELACLGVVSERTRWRKTLIQALIFAPKKGTP